MKSQKVELYAITVPSNRMRQLRPETVNEVAESIQKHGLLQPIVVRPKTKGEGYTLVAGHHRLEAAQQLRLKTIDCRIVDGIDADEARLAEIDENLIRADLTPSERAAHHAERKALYLKLHPETKRGAAGGEATAAKAGKSKMAKGQNGPQPPAYAKDAAKKTGQSSRTIKRDVTRGEKIDHDVLTGLAGTSLDKGDELDAMAKLPKSQQRKLAKRAKAGEKVSAKTTVKAMHRAEREKELAGKIIALPHSKYGVIYCDPGWKFQPYSEETGMDRSAENHYTCEDIDAIKDWKVRNIASDDCVLFMWVTVPFEAKGHEVIKAWGFEYVSQVVWIKDKIGTGYWFRNKHEILLVGKRKGGKPVAPAPGTQWESVIVARVGKHSAKPELVAEMIEAYFPNVPKIELNRRGTQ
jgi:ParB-like chromosome segregation protein Spo0J/N6-adenosine-specific RNA methylase IME4